MHVPQGLAATAPTIDPALFREVLGHYPTGVVLVTALDDSAEPVGMVVGTFSSVSLDPALVAFMPMRESKTFERLRTASAFCVNVLAADQEEVCRHFARAGTDKFSTVDWSPSASGAPVLDGVVAVMDCTFESITDAGDHFIVLGRVNDLQVIKPDAPLLFFQGGYGRFVSTSLVSYTDADVVAGVRLAELARGPMERIATDLDVACTAFAPAGNDLCVVAVAVGRNASSQIGLGSRVPLIPPLGEQYVANMPAEVAERWIRRSAAGGDAAVAARYRERLRLARQRGWSVSIAGGHTDRDVIDAVREYSEGEVTPARLAHVLSVIRTSDASYEPVEFVDGERYDVGTISAPVMSADDDVHLTLRLSQLPAQATARDIASWAERLKAVAAEVAAMAGEASWGLAPRPPTEARR